MKIRTEYLGRKKRITRFQEYHCTCEKWSSNIYSKGFRCKHIRELESELKTNRYYNYYLYIFFFFIIGTPIGILIEDYNTGVALSVPLLAIAHYIIKKIKRPLEYVKEFDS